MLYKRLCKLALEFDINNRNCDNLLDDANLEEPYKKFFASILVRVSPNNY